MRQSALLLASALLGAGCAPVAPVLRAQYGASMPLAGAAAKASHTLALDVGVQETGPGAGFGGGLDIRFRPAGDVTGGQVGASATMTVSGESPRAPFFYGLLGLGLLGTTNVESEHTESGSFDLLSPHLDLALGIPIARGLAVSVGVSLQYLWRMDTGNAAQRDVLLGSVTLGLGFFDPHVPPEENALGFFFR